MQSGRVRQLAVDLEDSGASCWPSPRLGHTRPRRTRGRRLLRPASVSSRSHRRFGTEVSEKCRLVWPEMSRRRSGLEPSSKPVEKWQNMHLSSAPLKSKVWPYKSLNSTVPIIKTSGRSSYASTIIIYDSTIILTWKFLTLRFTIVNCFVWLTTENSRFCKGRVKEILKLWLLWCWKFAFLNQTIFLVRFDYGHLSGQTFTVSKFNAV